MTDQLSLMDAVKRPGSKPLSDGPLRILLVEDNPGDARLVEEAFRQQSGQPEANWQYNIFSVPRISEAIKAIRSRDFELALLDLGLPDSQGVETIRRIRAADAYLPIVVLTGLDDQEAAMRAMRAGAQDYLIKGEFDGELLARTVRYSLERSRLTKILEREATANKLILSSLSAHIAVLNHDGEIVRTNQAWDQFSRDNGGKPEDTGIGADYVKELEQAVEQGVEGAGEALECIQRVMEGVSEFEELEYACHSPDEKRWFAMRVTPLAEPGQEGIVVAHENITERRQAEFQLQQRSRELSTILDHTPDIIARLDLDGRHTYISPSIEQHTGHPPEYYIGKTDAELGLPPERVEIGERVRQQVAETGEPTQVEYVADFRSENGSTTPAYQAKVVPEFNEDGDVKSILLVIRDISDLKETQEQVETRETVLKAVSFTAQKLLVSSDWKQSIAPVLARLGKAVEVHRTYLWRNENGPDGQLLTSQFAEWTAEPELALQDAEALQAASYEQLGFSRWRDLLSQGENIEGPIEQFPSAEREFLAQQGIQSLVVVPIFAGDDWWGFLGFDDVKRTRTWDGPIVESLKAAAASIGSAIANQRSQAKIERNERRFRSMVQNAADIITVVDADGTILYESPSLERVMGFKPEDVLGLNVFDPVHPEDRQEVIAQFEQLVANPGSHMQTDLRLYAADGEPRTLEVVGMNLLDDPAINGVVLNSRDITERREAENELKEREKQYRLLAENATDHIWQVDRKLNFIYSSPSVERLFGYSVEEYVGTNLSEYVEWPQYFKLAKVALRKMREYPDVEPVILETEVLDADGRSVPVEVSAGPLDDDEGNLIGIQGTTRDIRERKQAEMALKESEKRYRSLFATIPDGIVTVDRQRRIMQVNPGFAEMFGYSVEEMIGRDSEFLYPSKQVYEQVGRKAREAAKDSDGSIAYSKIPLVKKNGDEFIAEIKADTLYDSEGKIVGNVGVFRDVTERLKTQQALRMSEERYRSLFNSIRDAILVADQERRIIQCNPAFTDIFGYEQDEILGKPTVMLYKDPAEFEMLGQRISELRESGESRSTVTVQYRRKNGEVFPGETGIYSLTKDSGEAVGAIGLIRDVTARARRQREQEAIAQVAEALRAAENRQEMPPIILEQLMDLLEAGGAEMVLYDADQERVWVELASGSWQHFTGLELDVDEEFIGEVLSEEKSLYIEDVQQLPGFIGAESLEKDRSACVVPMKAGQDPIGLLWVAREEPIKDYELSVIQAIADMSANALRRAGLHEETRARARQMSEVSLLGQDLAEKLDEFAIYERLVEGTKQLLPDISTVIVARYRKENEQFHCVYGEHEEELIDVGQLEPVPLEAPGEGTQSEAVHTRRPIIKHDLREMMEHRPGAIQGGGERHTASGLYVPMIAEGDVIGVIQAQSYTKNRFSKLDGEIMAMVANTAAVALENADLLREAQGSAIELAMAYDTTLEGWARALELRDKETEGHTRRVTNLTVQLASRLEVPADQMVHVRRGALMHDIGKMGIPDSILLKPGKLNEEEWEIMREHPQMAYNMLEQVNFLRPALTIPLYHHERWDGSGYPEGLEGEEIPLEARIFAVVDVYDALSSDRPYRDAWPQEKVHSYLKENAGVEFDPKVVEAFFELIEVEEAAAAE